MAAPPQTYAHPPPPAVHAPAQQGPGMLAQMAATAGSVAVGSTIGHGLSNMIFGGGGHAPAPVAEAAPPAQAQQMSYARSCDFQAKGMYSGQNETRNSGLPRLPIFRIHEVLRNC